MDSGEITFPHAAHFRLHLLPAQLMQELHHGQQVHKSEHGPPCGLPYEGIHRSGISPGQRHLANAPYTSQDYPGFTLRPLDMEKLKPPPVEGMERVCYLNQLYTV
jgi:hypothetical protein